MKYGIVCTGCYSGQTRSCYPINADVEIECMTYRCTKRVDSMFFYYSFDPVYSASELFSQLFTHIRWWAIDLVWVITTD